MFKLFSLLLLPVMLMADIVDPAVVTSPDDETGRFMYEFLKMLGVLSVMVAVLLGFSWYMRRLTGNTFVKSNDESIIKLIDRRSLSARTILYLLEIEGKSVLVGETPHGIVRLMDEK